MRETQQIKWAMARGECLSYLKGMISLLIADAWAMAESLYFYIMSPGFLMLPSYMFNSHVKYVCRRKWPYSAVLHPWLRGRNTFSGV